MLILDCNSGFYYKILNFYQIQVLFGVNFYFSLSFLLKTKTQNQTSEWWWLLLQKKVSQVEACFTGSFFFSSKLDGKVAHR